MAIIETYSVEKPGILYDSLSPRFSISIFIHQLLLHITFPLLLPYFMWRYGWHFIYAQNFDPTSLGRFFFNWLAPFLVYLSIISACLAPERGIAYAAIVPTSVFLIHRCMVSLKYATLSDTEYRRFMRGDTPKGTPLASSVPTPEQINTARQYQQQIQLLTGWVYIPQETLQFEILTSGARNGIDLNGTYFHIADPATSALAYAQFTRWKGLLQGCFPQENVENDIMVRNGDGYRVSLYAVCYALLMRVRDPPLSRGTTAIILLFFSLLHASIPFFLDTTWSNISNWGRTCYALASISETLWYFVILNFVQCAFADAFRRYRLAQLLIHMIRNVDIQLGVALRLKAKDTSMKTLAEKDAVRNIIRQASRKQDVESPASADDDVFVSDAILSDDMIPKVDMNCAANIAAWLNVRRTMQEFGNRVKFRLDIYIGAVMLIITLLLLWMAVNVFISDNPRRFATSPPFIQILFTVVLFSLLLTGYILIGNAVNFKMRRHRYRVLENLLSTREKCRRLRRMIASHPDNTALETELQAMEECVTESTVTIQAIDISDIEKPMRILGVKCETSVAISLESAVVFVVLMGVRYIANGAIYV